MDSFSSSSSSAIFFILDSGRDRSSGFSGASSFSPFPSTLAIDLRLSPLSWWSEELDWRL